jgi:hypothetical protein
LGQLILRLRPILPPTLFPRLELAVERRNFLAHHFWYERSHLMMSLEGLHAMIDELSTDTGLFSELDEEIDRLVEPLSSRLGIDPEIRARVLSEILTGREPEPLNQQRKPKKEEMIVAVFNAPAESNRNVLIFQTEDGALWQLCDAGLGWAPCDKVDPSWPVANKFGSLLPAKTNPRPPVKAPWTFDLQIGPKAHLAVRPGRISGEVLYKLHERC